MCRYGLDALLPVTLSARCAACACVLDTPLSGPICPTCWNRVRVLSGPVCRTCGDALLSWRIISVTLEQCPRCRRRHGAVDAARAAGDYEGPLRQMLHAFKNGGRRGLAKPLALMMRTAGAELLGDAEAVIPVPLHPWRRVRRGYNQADELARRLDVPTLRALWRARHRTAGGSERRRAPTQRQERLHAVAFSASRGAEGCSKVALWS